MAYVYLHKKDNGEIFYVGKGVGYRAWAKSNRNRYWKNVSKKYGLNVVIFKDGLSHEEALELESELISAIGRDSLTNLTDGGDGISGFTHSEETKRKIGEANSKTSSWSKGKKLSEKHRKGIGKGNSKPVQQLDLNGNIVAEYKSVVEAIKQTGITGIYGVCLGIKKTAKGYKFKYINNK